MSHLPTRLLWLLKTLAGRQEPIGDDYHSRKPAEQADAIAHSIDVTNSENNAIATIDQLDYLTKIPDCHLHKSAVLLSKDINIIIFTNIFIHLWVDGYIKTIIYKFK